MKKILIVSPYFAPENSTASVRFTKIAKYLQRIGYDITVICTQMNAQLVVDKTLEKDMKELKHIIRIRYPELLYYTLKRKWEAENNHTGVGGGYNGIGLQNKEFLCLGICAYL